MKREVWWGVRWGEKEVGTIFTWYSPTHGWQCAPDLLIARADARRAAKDARQDWPSSKARVVRVTVEYD